MNVSVIVPCYNAEPYLAQAIGSVLDQGRSPHEIIVVDDGSTDGSLAIARRFDAGCGGLVRAYTKHSGSAARTRNIGASLATGDALMFLDADDVLAPDVLESLTDALSRRPEAIAACPWRRLDYEGGKWMSRPASCAQRRPDEDALSAWLSGWYYPPCSVLWSKEAFLSTGGWDEEAALNDDGDLMMRALVSGIPFVETPSGTAYYRRMPDGEVSLSGKRYTYGGLSGRIAVLEKIARLLAERGKIRPYRAAISRAFRQIAVDASGQYGGLSEQARAYSRAYAPPVWTRATATRRLPATGTRSTAAHPRDRVEEIRFGIDRARSVVASSVSMEHPPEPPSRPIEPPTVSVIIPVYNRAHLLSRTLDSVLAQTFPDFEVLIVDDCSSDDPASVVEQYRDPRLMYLRQSANRGVAAARNRGLREARAPFVAFLDDDDEWFPEKLSLQVDLFSRLPADVGLIYTGVETVTGDGRRTLFEPTARGDLYRELLVRNLLHAGSNNVMMRRNVVRTVGFFDEGLPAIEDYDYWLRISRRYRFECIAAPLAGHHDMRNTSGGSAGDSLRTANRRASLDAQKLFYRKHGGEMRKAAVAHLFLLDSAHRHAMPATNDRKGARRLALQAYLLAPSSMATMKALVALFAPEPVRVMLRKLRRSVKSRRRVQAG